MILVNFAELDSNKHNHPHILKDEQIKLNRN